MTLDERFYFLNYRIKKRHLQILDYLHNKSDEVDEGGDGEVGDDSDATLFRIDESPEIAYMESAPKFGEDDVEEFAGVDEVKSQTSDESPIAASVFSRNKKMELQESMFLLKKQSTEVIERFDPLPWPPFTNTSNSVIGSDFGLLLFPSVVANERSDKPRDDGGGMTHPMFNKMSNRVHFLWVETDGAAKIFPAWILRATSFKGGTTLYNCGCCLLFLSAAAPQSIFQQPQSLRTSFTKQGSFVMS